MTAALASTNPLISPAEAIAQSQVHFTGKWRIIRYDGSLLSFDEYASRFDSARHSLAPHAPTRGECSIDAHLERGTAVILFQGDMDALLQQFPRSRRDALRDIDGFPGTHIRQHVFQRLTQDGVWVTTGIDPRPYALDRVDEMLKIAEQQQSRAVWYLAYGFVVTLLLIVAVFTDVEKLFGL